MTEEVSLGRFVEAYYSRVDSQSVIYLSVLVTAWMEQPPSISSPPIRFDLVDYVFFQLMVVTDVAWRNCFDVCTVRTHFSAAYQLVNVSLLGI